MKLCLLLAGLAAVASAQNFTQGGFLDFTGIGYPDTAPNDSGQAVGELLFRYEGSYNFGSGFRVSGGIDARADTHQQTELDFSWRDREERRPAFALRKLNATYSRGKFTLDVGKQFIRWGKVDFVRPTDRLAPQDYLNVVTPEDLAVTAARATYGSSTDSIDVVYSPWLTQTRAPLVNQRWAGLSGPKAAASIRELAPSIP